MKGPERDYSCFGSEQKGVFHRPRTFIDNFSTTLHSNTNDFPLTEKQQKMIKVYGMKTCPDCQWVDGQIQGDDRFQMIDIGEHVVLMKEFLRLRDTHAEFDEAKKLGMAGIPCFLLEDGTVTLDPAAVGLLAEPADGPACSLNGQGC